MIKSVKGKKISEESYKTLDENIDYSEGAVEFLARCETQKFLQMKQTKIDIDFQNIETDQEFYNKEDTEKTRLHNLKENKEFNSYNDVDSDEMDMKTKKELMRKRRNAICELSIEERCGLTLFIESYIFEKHTSSLGLVF